MYKSLTNLLLLLRLYTNDKAYASITNIILIMTFSSVEFILNII